MTELRLTTVALLRGKAVPFRDGETSAIAKQAVDGPVRIGPLGLEGDEQADWVHHGGLDKAVHLYPYDHYPWWREQVGDHPLLNAPGGFGENIATTGADEHALCLGDRFRFGTALLEISHGRKPCWKIDHRFGRRGMLAIAVKSGRCGVYFRVIEPGEAQAGDPMTLIDRPMPHWTIDRLFALLVRDRPGPSDRDALAGLAVDPVLAEAWRDVAATRLKSTFPHPTLDLAPPPGESLRSAIRE